MCTKFGQFLLWKDYFWRPVHSGEHLKHTDPSRAKLFSRLLVEQKLGKGAPSVKHLFQDSRSFRQIPPVVHEVNFEQYFCRILLY